MNAIAPKLRIFFGIDGSRRSFYWFQCIGEDLYWGTSSPKKFLLLGEAKGPEATFSLDAMEKRCVSEAKSSYHASGEFHIKTAENNGEIAYTSTMYWPTEKAKDGPFRIAALFTCPPDSYPEYPRSPTRKGGRAIQIECLGNAKDVRFYIEAYLCKEGAFEFPKTLVAVDPNAKYEFLHSSLNEKYLLALRIWPLNVKHTFNQWNPDLEICFNEVHPNQ